MTGIAIPPQAWFCTRTFAPHDQTKSTLWFYLETLGDFDILMEYGLRSGWTMPQVMCKPSYGHEFTESVKTLLKKMSGGHGDAGGMIDVGPAAITVIFYNIFDFNIPFPCKIRLSCSSYESTMICIDALAEKHARLASIEIFDCAPASNEEFEAVVKQKGYGPRFYYNDCSKYRHIKFLNSYVEAHLG